MNRGGPRDISVLATTLVNSKELYNILIELPDIKNNKVLKNIIDSLSPNLKQYSELLPNILKAFDLEVY